MKTYPRYKQQAGFTLIELMVASAVFIVITVSGVSVLLNAVNNYRTTSEIRQSMDTLAFVMEDMTRTIRLGTVFHCISWSGADTFQACPMNTTTAPGTMGGYFLSLEAFDGSKSDPNDQVMYWISWPSAADADKAVLYKKNKSTPGMPAGSSPMAPLFSPITPSNVYLDASKSGFSVSDPGDPLATPIITVRLAGVAKYRNTSVPFDIQATVAPRNIPSPTQ